MKKLIILSSLLALTSLVSASYVAMPADYAIIEKTAEAIDRLPEAHLPFVNIKLDNAMNSLPSDDRLHYIVRHVGLFVKNKMERDTAVSVDDFFATLFPVSQKPLKKVVSDIAPVAHQERNPVDFYTKDVSFNAYNKTLQIAVCNKEGKYHGPLTIAVIVDGQKTERNIIVQAQEGCFSYVLKAAEFGLVRSDKPHVVVILDPQNIIGENPHNNFFETKITLPENFNSEVTSNGSGKSDLIVRDIQLTKTPACIGCEKLIVSVCNEGTKSVDMSQITTAVRVGSTGIRYPQDHTNTVLDKNECDDISLQLQDLAPFSARRSYTFQVKTDFLQVIAESDEVNNTQIKVINR